MKIGFDLLGLAHPKYPVERLIVALPDKIPIGYLDQTFGKDLSHLIAVLNSRKVIAVRVHLINAVCCRNKNCCAPDWIGNKTDLEKAILRGKLDDRVITRTLLFLELSQRFPAIEWFVSPLLEHDQTLPAWSRLADVVLTTMPNAQLVNNPHTGWNGRHRGSLLETHNGSSRGKCSSLDGWKDGRGLFGMTALARKKWREETKRHKYRLSWIAAANLRGVGPRICPLKRKNLLTEGVIEKWVHQTYN